MAAIDSRDLTTLAHALAGEKVSLGDLASVLGKMLENLASSLGGDKKKARRIFLESLPKDVRPVFEVLLPKGKPGKPKGPHDPLADQQLISLWENWKLQNSDGTKQQFEEWWDACWCKGQSSHHHKGGIVQRLGRSIKRQKPNSG